MVDNQKVLELLGSGISNEQVASTVGCSASYISQLLADSTFAEKVVALRVSNLTEASTRDKKINAIEDDLIDLLQDAIDSHLIYKPADIRASFAVVNAAKRRGAAAGGAININQTVVNLNIPPAVVRQFTKNVQGEVIEVEGQTLVTMPAHQLLKELVSKSGVNNEAYAKVSRHLPSAIEHGVHETYNQQSQQQASDRSSNG